MTAALPAPSVSETAIDALFAHSEAARWDVSREAFALAVRRAMAKLAPRSSSPQVVSDAMVASVHARDLALALGCADGHGAAWDHFVLTYRPELYRAARAMTDDATGRELADSLYADLFGLSERDGVRRSLFRYYHGRAKLSTWLRSVLAQRHVDLIRAQRRTNSLDDPEHPLEARLPVRLPEEPGRAAAMCTAAAAITVALAALAADSRMRLAYYYAHGLTLAQAGRLFGESEATASRKLERARQALRAGIESALRDRGLGLADVDDWAAVANDSWNATLVEALGVAAPQENAAPPFKGKRTP
ncbi:MAG: sigma-70 family RNA polymerase sigma factor [Acidobacteriota bacterium]